MADVKLDDAIQDASLAGTERLLTTEFKYILLSSLASYTIDTLVGAAAVTPTTGDALVMERSGTPGTFDLDALASYVVGVAFDSAAVTSTSTGDLLVLERSGVAKRITIDNLSTSILTGAQASVLNLSGLTAATLGSTDTLLVCQSTTPLKVTLANLEAKLWADYAAYVAGLSAVVTTAANDKLYCLQGGVAKYVTVEGLVDYMLGNAGNVFGPTVTTTPTNIPQWDTSTNTLKDGLALVTTVRTVASGASDTCVPTEQAVREMMTEGPDIVGMTDIGAAIADVDLVVLDDGASGTKRKSTFSRIWTWVTGKIQALTTKTTPVSADYLVLQDTSGSDVKKVSVGNLWTTRYLLDATAVKLDDFAACDDNTDLNSSTSAHGLLPKLVGGTSSFLRADGQWSVPTWDGTISTLDIDGGTDIGQALSDADLMIVDRGATGTNRKSAVGRIWTYFWEKAAVVAGKSTPANADSLLLMDSAASNAPKALTIQNLLTSCWAYVSSSLSSLAEKTTPVSADKVVILDSAASSAAKYATITAVSSAVASTIKLDDLATPDDNTDLNASSSRHGLTPKLSGSTSDFLRGDGTWHNPAAASAGRWTVLDVSTYTDTPASTSRITMSSTTDLAVGLPVRYTYGGTAYHGVIAALSSNAYIDVSGPPLNTGSDLTELAVGTAEMVSQANFFVSGMYGATAQDMLLAIMKTYFLWRGPQAALVAFSATHQTVDSGTQPKVNVKINGSYVSNNDSNNGIQLSTAGTWVHTTLAVNPSAYIISYGQAMEVACTVVGGSANASNLTVECIFVNV